MERSLWKLSMPEILSTSNTQIVQKCCKKMGFYQIGMARCARNVEKASFQAKPEMTCRSTDAQPTNVQSSWCLTTCTRCSRSPPAALTSPCSCKLLSSFFVSLASRLQLPAFSFTSTTRCMNPWANAWTCCEKPMLSERRRRSSSATAALGLMLKQTNQPLVATFSQTRARNVCGGSNGLALCREGSPRHCC